MKAYVLNIWDWIRSSYWFVPLQLAVGATLLALAMPQLDWFVVERDWKLPENVRTTTDTARVTLSAMVGAMVAVTGTVFSITVVTLSLTSQQFGPRLLRRFMVDLPTQITLGTFLSTAFYCLLILRIVERHENAPGAPNLSVVVAVVLTLVSMVLLIVFIHHTAKMIQAPHVVASVALDLHDAIGRLFPERVGEDSEATEDQPQTDTEQANVLAELDSPHLQLRATKEGYIQSIDASGLLHFAVSNDVIFRLYVRPGDFIADRSLLAEVWIKRADLVEQISRSAWTSIINERVIVGARRTPRQDLECAIDELAEVAVRALSPGINDPFTAMTCVDRLGAALGELARRRMPGPNRFDEQGELRLITDPESFSGALDAAFNQIRQYGRDSVAVSIRLLEALTFIAKSVCRHEDRKSVKMHVEMIARHAEFFPEEHDKREIRERKARAMAAIGDVA